MNPAAFVPLLLLYPQTAAEPRFAVACTGSAHAYGNSLGKLRDRNYTLPRQVFVVDPATNAVTRALEPRQEFDPVCAGPGAFSSVSPGLIQARTETAESGVVTTCKFELDRMSGKGSYELRTRWADGRYESFDWSMACAKSEIPVFDLTKRKF